MRKFELQESSPESIIVNIIDTIKQYENDNFGEVNTDFSDPEKVVYMYVYIIGEEIVLDYRNQLEDKGERQNDV